VQPIFSEIELIARPLRRVFSLLREHHSISDL
jgi:hypothetical protein